MRKEPIPIRGFDENGPVRIYAEGFMPHWRQAGCTYFVTFRLADSLPTKVVQEIEYDRRRWLEIRGICPDAPDWKRTFAALDAKERRLYERFFAQRLNESLDQCHGSCILQRPDIAQQIATALDFFHRQRVLTGDWVIMPNHVHALMTPLAGFELEDVMHSIKSFTANEISRALGMQGPLWQRESYDHIARDGDQLLAFQRYIAANPEKANLRQGQYLSSTATYSFDS